MAVFNNASLIIILKDIAHTLALPVCAAQLQFVVGLAWKYIGDQITLINLASLGRVPGDSS